VSVASGAAGCAVFAHSGGAQIAIMAEAHKPGTFAVVYAFEPVLWPVSLAARYSALHHQQDLVICLTEFLASSNRPGALAG